LFIVGIHHIFNGLFYIYFDFFHLIFFHHIVICWNLCIWFIFDFFLFFILIIFIFLPLHFSHLDYYFLFSHIFFPYLYLLANHNYYYLAYFNGIVIIICIICIYFSISCLSPLEIRTNDTILFLFFFALHLIYFNLDYLSLFLVTGFRVSKAY